MPTPAAFFDLDGTLCTGHIWRGLSRYCKQHRVNRRILYPFLFAHMAMWIASKARLIGEARFAASWGRDMAVLLRGLSMEEGQRVFQAILHEEVLPTLRPNVVQALRWHQEQGHLVVLASGTFQELLQAIAAELGLEHAVGSSLEMRDGRYSGRLRSPFCFGRYKARLTQNYLATRGLSVDWSASYAYADRIYDLPLLELVGHPVTAYPDEALKAVAQSRGWNTLPVGY